MPRIYGFNYNSHVRHQLYELNINLVSDIGVLQCMKYVTPVLDANMFIIYGSENGYDVSDLSTKDLTELASLYENQIKAYVTNKVRGKLQEILVRWSVIFKKFNVIPTLNEPMYRQFVSCSKNIEAIAYKFSNVNTEAIVAALQSIKYDCMRMTESRLSLIEERVPVDPEIVNKFFSYIIDWSRLDSNNRLTDIKQYGYLNNEVIEIASTYLRMLLTGCDNSISIRLDDVDDIYDNISSGMASLITNSGATLDYKPAIDGLVDYGPQCRIYIRKSRALQPCHVLALDTTWIDGLILPSTPIVYDNISSKMASLLIISGSTTDVANRVWADQQSKKKREE